MTSAVEVKRLDLHINFPKSRRFAYSVCGEEYPVHDALDHNNTVAHGCKGLK
ncbi:protein of unknown function [Acidithiobacillus ferrivorans]|uniref:C2H2-type domain-containing protein n=1 Tax=Acidithiobacillus ferrivorans TaxID=160808 RepID=A0ABY1MV01_9PROT|nr:protein of unknown function [Acidithiobacillus ferrivorans]